jgi:hypothetical protein
MKNILRVGFLVSVILAAKPLPVTIPNLADISWSPKVAKIEKTIAQRSEYPKLVPAIVHIVTVPGPMNAAVTRVAGPMFFSSFIYLFSKRVIDFKLTTEGIICRRQLLQNSDLSLTSDIELG